MEGVTLSQSLWNGIQDYLGTSGGKYDAVRIGSLGLSCLPVSEGVDGLNRTFGGFMDISDATDIFPDGMGALKDFKNNIEANRHKMENHKGLVAKITCIKDEILELIQNVGGVAIDSLVIVAVSGATGLLDLGKIAADIGGAEIYGAAPLAFVAKIALCPTIHVIAIVVLSASTLSQIGKIRQASDKSAESPQIRREAQYKIAKNATNIALHTLHLSAIACPPVLLGMGFVAAFTGVVEGVVKTDSMRAYFNSEG